MKTIALHFLSCVLLVQGSPAFACKCVALGDREQAFARSSRVFSGTVLDSRFVHKAQEPHLAVKFRVDRAWKGVQDRTVEIKAGAPHACGFQFFAGQKYLVYASEDGPAFTSRCGFTKPLAQADEDLKALGPGKKPASGLSAADAYAIVAREGSGSGGMTRFFYDINDDGQQDLFLGANAEIGNGGGPFHVFLKKGRSYNDLGVISIQPEALQMSNAKHFGIRDLRTCSHGGSGNYGCVTYVFDGGAFRATDLGQIKAERFPSEIRPTALKIERSDKGFDR